MKIEPKKIQLILATNEKSYVITKEKVASRFIESLYTDISSILITSELDIEYLENNKNFQNLIDAKNNKKDIIFLYRHPYNRFISGVIQNTVIELFTNIYRKYMLIPYIKKYNIDINELISELSFSNDSSKMKQIEEMMNIQKYKSFFTEIITDYILWSVYTQSNSNPHIDNYLISYDFFIKSNKIDTNKLCLINIDNTKNDLNKIFKNYTDSRKHDGTFSNKIYFNLVENIINKNNIIKNYINNLINIDLYFYNQMEKSKYNILNKS